jgi:tRNA threonylcarbamoyladenosine biosynthesis protein TsaB
MAAWLVLDTAFPTAVVGVVDVETASVLAEVLLPETRRHAEGLPDAAAQALADAKLSFVDVRGVACGVGPGSFVGVRVGMAWAKGVCLARGVPLLGLPSLVSMAAGVAGLAGCGVAILDAKRGEVFLQRLSAAAGHVSADGEASAHSLDAARAIAQRAAFVVGTGVGLLALGDETGPSALGLLRQLQVRLVQGTADETEVLVPRYARDADAKAPDVHPTTRSDVLDALAAGTARDEA